MSGIEENILSALAYFDLFSYPLSRGEIYLFLPDKCDMDDFSHALAALVNDRQVFRFEKFYSLKNDYYLAERRRAGNKRAAQLMIKAKMVGNILIKCPYVRGVAISGSLSKNFADENADIDLFIIAAKNRLWIARSLTHAFKKLAYLFNMQHYLCMNYYVDEQGLEIPEQNIYTATEVVTLIPLQGDMAFVDFFTANAWSRGFLPNNVMRVSTAPTGKQNWFKAGIERMLNNKFGDWLDNRLLKVTAARWTKKTQSKKRNTKGMVMAIDTGKHFAKPNPGNFQKYLIARYELKVESLLKQTKHSLAK